MNEKQLELISTLKAFSYSSYQQLWKLTGVIDTILSDSKIISETYQTIINPPPQGNNSDLKFISESKQKELKNLNESLQRLRGQLGKESEEEGTAYIEEQVKILEVEKRTGDSLLGSDPPTDFEILNEVYGLKLVETKQKFGEDYNARMTPYYFYNDIFGSVQQYLLVSNEGVVDQNATQKILFDVYAYNIKMQSLQHDLEETFTDDKLMQLGFRKQTIADKFDQQLQRRIESLFAILDDTNSDEKLQPLISLMKEYAQQELLLISQFLLQVSSPETIKQSSEIIQRLYISKESEQLLRKIFKIKDDEQIELKEILKKRYTKEKKHAPLALLIWKFLHSYKMDQEEFIQGMKEYNTNLKEYEKQKLSTIVGNFFGQKKEVHTSHDVDSFIKNIENKANELRPLLPTKTSAPQHH